ncbi:hypothetical protein FANTH_4014 [Fusarium anthophilum]|uniref:C2H2-type domain-containing protein n=1 Tax=Fusarium anthophilum TaxID=48485 RepID=A0A8H4ZQK1_9HYPO|nr:hypothetical protein FANTH_4014 [Fusarium anthophilum]
MFSCSFGLFYAILQYLESPFRRNKVEAMVEPECCQCDLEQQLRQRNGTGETKRNTKWDLYLQNQPNTPLRRHAAPLSPRHNMEPPHWSTNGREDEDDSANFSSSERKLFQHALAICKDWKEKSEPITPPENELPPQNRFTSTHGQQMTHGQIYDGYDISDDDLIAISRPTRRPRDNLHLACPFYVYDPKKCYQCLLGSDLRSISDAIDHLFRSHSRPLYCPKCYGAFDTQICRDDHVLKGKCQRRTPGPLFGLSESQKSMLLEIDTNCTDDKEQWLLVWSIVFPDSDQPHSPYLEQGTK